MAVYVIIKAWAQGIWSIQLHQAQGRVQLQIPSAHADMPLHISTAITP